MRVLAGRAALPVNLAGRLTRLPPFPRVNACSSAGAEPAGRRGPYAAPVRSIEAAEMGRTSLYTVNRSVNAAEWARFHLRTGYADGYRRTSGKRRGEWA